MRCTGSARWFRPGLPCLGKSELTVGHKYHINLTREKRQQNFSCNPRIRDAHVPGSTRQHKESNCACPTSLCCCCADFSRKINNKALPRRSHICGCSAQSPCASFPLPAPLRVAPLALATRLTSSHFRNKIVIKHIGHVISFVCGILLPFFRAILNCYKCAGTQKPCVYSLLPLPPLLPSLPLRTYVFMMWKIS